MSSSCDSPVRKNTGICEKIGNARKLFYVGIFGLTLLGAYMGVWRWIAPAADPNCGAAEREAGGISDAELKKFAAIGRTNKDIADMQREIKEHQQDARATLIAALNRNRVLGMGETHHGANPHRRLGASLMRDFAAAGATHLAVELPIGEQARIDEFVRTGRLGTAELPYFIVHENYISLLHAARSAGLKVTCVDARPGEPRRDQHMAERIGEILDANANNKVVFWVGSLHLRRPVSDHPSARRYGVSAAELLAKRFTISTVVEVTEECHRHGPGFHPISILATHQREPIGLTMQRTPLLQQLPVFRASFGTTYGDWDIVIAYPGRW